MTADAAADGGFGVYVHWPFCAAKCPYCDFNSHVRAHVDQAVWADALCRELTHMAQKADRRPMGSIFFGGGTPSLMAPDTVGTVLEHIRSLWEVDPQVEVTLEANPTSVEAGRFAGYADVGINRISMGIQALNDTDLRALGRLHSADEAKAAFTIARRVFERVSFDLIYARQGQSRAAWREELAQALDMAVDHLSLYQLTIEPGTRFGDLAARGRLRDMPDDGLAADMYLETQDICAAAGMEAYETSNHARPGSACRHNLVYWRYGQYVGAGPGAHGRLVQGAQRVATETIRAPERWLEAVQATGTGQSDERRIKAREQAEEYLMMALRLAEGVSLSRYAALGGGALDQDQVNDMIKGGFLAQDGDRLKATRQGAPVLNAILRQLLP